MFSILINSVKRFSGWLLISILVAGFIFYSLILRASRIFKEQYPNIVFIMADDMGYGDLGCYNENSKISTPNIDRLAVEGMMFMDAHAAGAVCTPTRYSVLTGRYCWRSRLKSGVLRGYDKPLINSQRMTVASLLKQHGYRTACIGKWHLGFNWALKDENEKPVIAEKTIWHLPNVDYTKPIKGGPLTLGFDYFFGIPASLDMPPYCFVENNHTVGIPSVEKHPYHTLQRKGLMVPGWEDKEVGPTFTIKAIDFIKNHFKHHSDQPFFLYFALSAPHTPCCPPDFIKGKSNAGVRGDMVAEVDWTVGKVISTLDSLNLIENTLIIITSDNGGITVGPPSRASEPPAKYDMDHHGHLPNGSLRGQKSDIWEGGHRVPFIAYWSGKITPGRICDETICLTDLLATAAAIVNAELPKNAGEDSYNIIPILLGGEYEKPICGAVVHQSGGGMLAIRQGPWKLIDGRGSGGFSKPQYIEPKKGEPTGQLYNLKRDLAETENLWSQHPEIVDSLKKLFEKYKKEGQSR